MGIAHVYLPGKSQGRGSWWGYCPWGRIRAHLLQASILPFTELPFLLLRHCYSQSPIAPPLEMVMIRAPTPPFHCHLAHPLMLAWRWLQRNGENSDSARAMLAEEMRTVRKPPLTAAPGQQHLALFRSGQLLASRRTALTPG